MDFSLLYYFLRIIYLWRLYASGKFWLLKYRGTKWNPEPRIGQNSTEFCHWNLHRQDFACCLENIACSDQIETITDI